MDRRKFVKKAVVSSAGVFTATSFDFPNYGLSQVMNSRINSNEAIVRVVDLNIGESVSITLYDGSKSQVKLLSLEEERDSIFKTLISTQVKVEINGIQADLVSSSYRLPVLVGGVQVDVPAVEGYMADASTDFWKLEKSARLRLWPGGSPWIKPGTFKYPVKQRWFASTTWYSNEPISPRVMGKVYYHAGMDFGAVEGLTEIVAATDGKIITLGDEVYRDHHPAARPRYDDIYIEDSRGWIYRYSHLCAFDPNLRPGDNVMMGQRLGYVGKEGSSGGWSHLHFHIESIQPSGILAIQDSYPFLWQSYIEEYNPKILAVARPHIKTLPGQPIVLDASRSWAKAGIRSYEWLFMDGVREFGAKVKRVYERPGTYSEIVKITDNEGNFDYDFIRVEVYPRVQEDTDMIIATSIPRVHVAYHPTFGIRPGDPVIFRSRGFELSKEGGVDIYDFGDGSPKVEVPSNINSAKHAANGYGTIVHHYKGPGDYIVRVDRIDDKTGNVGSQHLHIIVNPRSTLPKKVSGR